MVMWVVTALPLYSGGVRWNSSFFGDSYRDSEGQLLDSSWVFYLGYFSNTFAPTRQNQSQWAANWVTLDIAEYDPAISQFEAVWSNDGASSGNLGYIWGLNRSHPNNEWILMTNDSWIVPLNSELIPDVNWETSNASVFVVGNQAEEQIFVTEKTVGEPPLLIGSQWLAWMFEPTEQNDPQVGGWDADPDNDGLSNLAEFAFGTKPQVADTVQIEVMIEEGVFKFRSPKVRQVAVSYQGQVSSELINWEGGFGQVVLEREEFSSLLFRDLNPILQGPRFARVVVQLTQ